MTFMLQSLRAAFAGAVLLSFPAFAAAADVTAGDLTIRDAWTRATAPSAKVGGGYLTIINKGQDADRLVDVESTVSERGEIHEMVVKDGVMSMSKMADGLPVPAGETVTLEPGGLHVMFIDLKTPLKEGETVTARLTFEKAGSVDVTFDIRAMGQRQSHHGASHDHGH